MMENKITTFEDICRWVLENKSVYVYSSEANRCFGVEFLNLDFTSGCVRYINTANRIECNSYAHCFGLNSNSAKQSYIAYMRVQLKQREAELCTLEETE